MQKSVVEYLLVTEAIYKEKVAIHDSEGEMSFGQLLHRASILSTSVQKNAISMNSPIGVYIPKSAKKIVSFVASSISGCFYVPLDVKSPHSRVESIIETLQTELIITDRAHLSALQDFYKGTILVYEDEIENEIVDSKVWERLNHQIDTDPVYTIFTSGSTGVPKGVSITHRAVIDYIDHLISLFGIDSTYVMGNQAPFYFDNSILDIYLMMATGATLDIIPDSNFAFPSAMVEYLNERKINFIFWVPSALTYLANSKILEKKIPQYLKNVFFCGEVMPTKTLSILQKSLPKDVRYCNLYGPTEITDACTYYLVDREFSETESLPIGIPFPNTDIIILVDRKRRAKQSEQGELCVRGSSIALGYYNNPAKTQDAFIINPLQPNYNEYIYCTGDIVYQQEDGNIIYVGRCDSQIKHKGYRIELGEIENRCSAAMPQLKELCVVYNKVQQKIVLYYDAAEPIEVVEFRKKLLEYLPAYMMPNTYIQVQMQHNANGKIDRAYYNKLQNE